MSLHIGMTETWECADCCRTFEVEPKFAFSYCPYCYGGTTRRGSQWTDDHRKAGALDDARAALVSAREDFVESQRIADEDYDEWSSQTQDVYNHAVNAIKRVDAALRRISSGGDQ